MAAVYIEMADGNQLQAMMSTAWPPAWAPPYLMAHYLKSKKCLWVWTIYDEGRVRILLWFSNIERPKMTREYKKKTHLKPEGKKKLSPHRYSMACHFSLWGSLTSVTQSVTYKTHSAQWNHSHQLDDWISNITWSGRQREQEIKKEKTKDRNEKIRLC